MFRFVLIVWLVASVSPVLAQEICGFGGEQNFNKTEQLLKEAKTCAEAAKDLNACAWGSSADNMFAGVVIAKCEQEFRGNISPFADRRYKQELNFCGYEFEKQDGTMSISAAAMCAAGVAADYASSPARRKDQPLRSSFDCALAKSEVEKTICSDGRLGEADIVMSRVYRQTLRQQGFAYQQALRSDQKAWLASLPRVCRPSHSDRMRFATCLREQIEIRYSMIDICREGAMNETSWTSSHFVSCLRDTRSLRH